MKIVIDTNVVASALLFGGKPRQLLHLAVQEKVKACVSEQIVNEYKEIIERLSKKYPNKKTRGVTFSDFIAATDFVIPSRKITACRDSGDDKFIECAVEAKSLYIVSGDNDLLTLKEVEGVEIITVAEFFARFPDFTEAN